MTKPHFNLTYPLQENIIRLKLEYWTESGEKRSEEARFELPEGSADWTEKTLEFTNKETVYSPLAMLSAKLNHGGVIQLRSLSLSPAK